MTGLGKGHEDDLSSVQDASFYSGGRLPTDALRPQPDGERPHFAACWLPRELGQVSELLLLWRLMSTQGALSLHHDGDVGRIKLIPSLRCALVIGSFPRSFFAVDFVTARQPLTRGRLGELPRQMVTDQILIVDVCDPVFPPATNLWSADSSGLSTPCAPLSQSEIAGSKRGPRKTRDRTLGR